MTKGVRFNGRNRQQFARAIRLAEDRLILKYRRRFAAEMVRAAKEYAAAYAAHREGGLAAVTSEHLARLEDILSGLGYETARKFARVPMAGVKDFDTEFEERIYETVRDNAVRAALGVASRTQDWVMHVIAGGLADEAGPDAIVQRIADHGKSLTSRARAATIARTEVHTAANYVQYSMVEAAGVEAKREWISTNDHRVREDHATADGQIVSGNDPFSVGGESLQFPGDPRGSAENTINCRCVVGYITEN